MSNAHKYYEPTEYEQMVIAAGWVTIESLDPQYQEYCAKSDEPMTYNQWQRCCREWDALNQEYIERGFDPYPLTPGKAQQEADRLLRRMSDLEIYLGY